MKNPGPLEGGPGQGEQNSDQNCTPLVPRPAAQSKARDPQPLLRCLAELFPRTFTAEKHLPHRPLKIGIDKDLRAAGVLTSHRERGALGVYTGRRMYLLAVVEGAARIDLEGNPAGCVTAEEAAHARGRLARIDALADERVRAAREERRTRWSQLKQRRCAVSTNVAIAIETPQPINGADGRSAANAAPPRLGLAGLKAAALARRNGEARR